MHSAVSAVTGCKRSFSSHVGRYLKYSFRVCLVWFLVCVCFWVVFFYDSLLAGSVYAICCSYCAFYFQGFTHLSL